MPVRDWVVNTATWQQASLTGGLYNGQGALDAAGELAIFPLTFNKAEPTVLGEFGIPEIADSMTACCVMGYINWHLTNVDADNPVLANVYERNWRATLAARITRYPQEPGGQQIGDLVDYDLTAVPPANDQFVWHYEKHLVNQSRNDWLGTSGSKAPICGTIRVQSRFKRRLEELECMAVAVSFLQGNQPANQPWEDVGGVVFLDYQMHLRTFVIA